MSGGAMPATGTPAASSGAMPSPRGLAELAGLPIVKRRHFGRWLAAAALIVALLWIGKAFAEGQIAWNVVRQFLTAPAILAGLATTVALPVPSAEMSNEEIIANAESAAPAAVGKNARIVTFDENLNMVVLREGQWRSGGDCASPVHAAP